jgi:hypothetical protein
MCYDDDKPKRGSELMEVNDPGSEALTASSLQPAAETSHVLMPRLVAPVL